MGVPAYFSFIVKNHSNIIRKLSSNPIKVDNFKTITVSIYEFTQFKSCQVTAKVDYFDFPYEIFEAPMGIKKNICGCFLGCFKTPLSSQTEKLMAGTKFSDYLGLKHYKNAKKIKHFIHLALAYRPQSFTSYHKYITSREFRLPTRKPCSTYVMCVKLAFLR